MGVYWSMCRLYYAWYLTSSQQHRRYSSSILFMYIYWCIRQLSVRPITNNPFFLRDFVLLFECTRRARSVVESWSNNSMNRWGLIFLLCFVNARVALALWSNRDRTTDQWHRWGLISGSRPFSAWARSTSVTTAPSTSRTPSGGPQSEPLLYFLAPL